MRTPVRTVRVDDDLWDAVSVLAEHHGTTASAIMVGALEIYVDAHADELPNARRQRTRRRKAHGYCTEPCQGVGVLHPYHGVGDTPTVLRHLAAGGPAPE